MYVVRIVPKNLHLEQMNQQLFQRKYKKEPQKIVLIRYSLLYLFLFLKLKKCLKEDISDDRRD